MSNVIKRLSSGSETIDTNGNRTSADIEYYIMSPSSKQSAMDALLGSVPSVYNGLSLKEIRFDGYDGSTGNINATAVYSNTSGSGGGGSSSDEPTESFECGGGSKHVVQAISQTVVYSKDGGETDDSGGGIGWNGKAGSEAQFSGVDVPTADMRESYTKKIKSSKMTTAYKKTVASLVGKVNSSRWRGWSAGEVMFLGMSCSGPVSGTLNVTYNFRIMPNEESCTIAGHNIGSKEGFEYVWARHKSKVDSNRKLNQEVERIYKSVVCKKGNFSSLGI